MGTPSISGIFSGVGRILVRAGSTPDLAGQTVAASMCNVAWEWDFDTHTLTIDDGNLYPSQIAPPLFNHCVGYTIRRPGGGAQPIPFVDNLDGTYTVPYQFTITNAGVQAAQADTTIRLEISLLHDCSSSMPPGEGTLNRISVTTVEDFWRGIPGRPFPSGSPGQFFLNATPSWEGCGMWPPETK
ncbi:hypothetical protein YS110_06300 [Acidovorax sp. YS12]|nr:hypothetical protein YS110_06300 [Acidovorax sp. YS12]